jgi:RNA polymerase sigma-70 factor, ECF subfamily
MATGDPDEADDVVQETLLRMHRSLADFRGDSRFTSWVYRITQSAAADLNRRRSSRLRKLFRLSRYRETGHELPPSIIGRIERERTLDLVRAFWEELPPGQRKILDLADFQGYKPAEIAEMLEMKAVTVRAHLFKARRTIRERILESAPEIVEEETG